ncbi:unnamed protein product [Ceutorhynchus assimilis]|uniref:SHSP domain-containing protein n=1 Tax=Ceutorhynchus assimilis TaxID=467358 RepID=A0A9N9QM51_9CUCU|nr:unnamed protein product [Ceutorhynchus assimilis]
MDKTVFYQDRFEILVDTRGYQPYEIKCLMTNKIVEVIAQKENQQDNAQKCNALMRQFVLPQNFVSENGQCCLSPDGVLTITAPWCCK